MHNEKKLFFEECKKKEISFTNTIKKLNGQIFKLCEENQVLKIKDKADKSKMLTVVSVTLNE